MILLEFGFHNIGRAKSAISTRNALGRYMGLSENFGIIVAKLFLEKDKKRERARRARGREERVSHIYYTDGCGSLSQDVLVCWHDPTFTARKMPIERERQIASWC